MTASFDMSSDDVDLDVNHTAPGEIPRSSSPALTRSIENTYRGAGSAEDVEMVRNVSAAELRQARNAILAFAIHEAFANAIETKLFKGDDSQVPVGRALYQLATATFWNLYIEKGTEGVQRLLIKLLALTVRQKLDLSSRIYSQSEFPQAKNSNEHE